MMRGTDPTQSFATDLKDLSALRQSAQQNSPEAVKGAAKQFEALFMNMLMKSMREASPQDGLFDNQQTKMYTAMLDQQLSQTMASRGVGLADVLTRQLSNIANPQTSPAENESMPLVPTLPQRPLNNVDATVVPVGRTANNQSAHVKSFQERVGLHAEEASRATGIPAKFMMAQAALESGWGRREIKAADGSPSFNLFGIKAGAGWKGKVVDARTTEYINGVAHTKVEKFRAYDSYADAFKDYARLLSKHPRYQSVIANAQDVRGFAVGLQRAGYATDPQYAAKLMNIINKSFSV